MKYTDKEYIDFDPFQGEMDVDIQMRKVKMVKTRKEHRCLGDLEHSTQHDIPAGSIARFESALIDSDYFGRYYWCIGCLDKEIDRYKNGYQDDD